MSRFVALWVLAACNPTPHADGGTYDSGRDASDADATVADSGVPGSGLVWDASITWGSCPEGSHPEAECATVLMPEDWAEPERGTIDVFVKRLRFGEPRRALWLLAGGPGVPASIGDHTPWLVDPPLPDMHIYLMDHRGTGSSEWLGCPLQEAAFSLGGTAIIEEEWPACIAAMQRRWGPSMTGFTTTNAAKDVAWMIDQTREPGQVVHLRGASYGTLHAQRYLQLFPDHVDAVTLHGIAAPTINFAEYDRGYEEAGSRFLSVCEADSFCSSKVGPDVVATFHEVYEGLADGSMCNETGVTPDTLRGVFGLALVAAFHERALIPALVYRLRRCSPADVDAIGYFFSTGLAAATGALSAADARSSVPMRVHILLSEYWNDDRSLEEHVAFHESSLFSNGVSIGLHNRAPTWPMYPRESLTGELATTSTPILMIEGELDPATPISGAEIVAANFDGANQHYFEIPYGAHTTASPTSEGTDCAITLFHEWLDDPTRRPSDCRSDVQPVDFRSTTELARLLFDTDDLWD